MTQAEWRQAFFDGRHKCADNPNQRPAASEIDGPEWRKLVFLEGWDYQRSILQEAARKSQ